MMDLMDVSNEIQETLGTSYNVPEDIDEEELMGGRFPNSLKSPLYCPGDVPCLNFFSFLFYFT